MPGGHDNLKVLLGKLLLCPYNSIKMHYIVIIWFPLQFLYIFHKQIARPVRPLYIVYTFITKVFLIKWFLSKTSFKVWKVLPPSQLHQLTFSVPGFWSGFCLSRLSKEYQFISVRLIDFWMILTFISANIQAAIREQRPQCWEQNFYETGLELKSDLTKWISRVDQQFWGIKSLN